MTVKELISALQELDPDRVVIIQKDGEGNGYSPLAGAEQVYYRAETTWCGEVHSVEDFAVGDAPAVVLWPVN